jgi:hypothetical protein
MLIRVRCNPIFESKTRLVFLPAVDALNREMYKHVAEYKV